MKLRQLFHVSIRVSLGRVSLRHVSLQHVSPWRKSLCTISPCQTHASLSRQTRPSHVWYMTVQHFGPCVLSVTCPCLPTSLQQKHQGKIFRPSVMSALLSFIVQRFCPCGLSVTHLCLPMSLSIFGDTFVSADVNKVLSLTCPCLPITPMLSSVTFTLSHRPLFLALCPFRHSCLPMSLCASSDMSLSADVSLYFHLHFRVSRCLFPAAPLQITTVSSFQSCPRTGLSWCVLVFLTL
jgi:hypothetical protein